MEECSLYLSESYYPRWQVRTTIFWTKSVLYQLSNTITHIRNSQMLSLHTVFNQNQWPPLLGTKKSSDVLSGRKAHPFNSIVCAKETDSQKFEVDPDKARQALQELDDQLQSFSKKQVTSPKKKVEEMNIPRSEMRGEMTEISESLLANSAVALFIFSIFYNVLFYTVIKPSIDAPLSTSITSTQPQVLQQLPLSYVFIPHFLPK